jgi:hypothetical protein
VVRYLLLRAMFITAVYVIYKERDLLDNVINGSFLDQELYRDPDERIILGIYCAF